MDTVDGAGLCDWGDGDDAFFGFGDETVEMLELDGESCFGSACCCWAWAPVNNTKYIRCHRGTIICKYNVSHTC